MGTKGAVAWLFGRLGGWVDDNPLRAVGVLVWTGALAALLMSAGVEVVPSEATLAYDGVTAAGLLQAATAQPAYVVGVAAGAVVFLFYDG